MPLLSFASPRVAFAVGAMAYVADPGLTLRVLRASPAGDAAPTATIAVTFDRPVAGSLDRSVDPTKLLTIDPAPPPLPRSRSSSVDNRPPWRVGFACGQAIACCGKPGVRP